MDITEWLSSLSASYSHGLLLLKTGDPSSVLISILEKGPTTYNRKRLRLELEKIASTSSIKSSSHHPSKSPKQIGRLSRDSYPPELHPAYDRQNQLYSIVNHLQPQLELLYLNDVSQCHQAVQEIMARWKEIDKIYELLDYWSEHKTILPNRYFVQDDQFQSTDIKEWIREKERLYKYIQRNKDNPHKAAEVASRRRQLAKVKSYLAHA